MNTAPAPTIDAKHFAFTTRAGEWQIFVNGRVVPADFSCEGAALAGIAVQLRRDARNQEIPK